MKNRLKKLSEYFKKQSFSKKVQIIVAAFMTMVFLIAVPVAAWFSYQRKMITMAKINSPAKLTLMSGHREDIIEFKLSGIDVGEGVAGSKDFVFGVEGKDISNYKLQLAHTTNINFDYSIYRAIEDDTNGTVRYTTADGSTVKYIKADLVLGDNSGTFVGERINGDTTGGRLIGTANYENKSYKGTDQLQDFAQPLYWQTGVINSKATYNGKTYNDYLGETCRSDKEFLNYYVLHIDWDENVVNDKETDLIYITAQVSK